ncbi:triose-phosphate isomerase [Geoalkalibacter sp.]|uniref:triose-phosphate isomerase n=1 Tax=Geoalkalibacter sp. TaxID=3041440 RepID=UPI00272E6249|nr:triose-phosphate isomerase [Geoalkalibacter sp.]
MRKPVIAGNWKLHKTIPEALELVEALKQGLADQTDVEIVVAPVFTALASVASTLKGSPIALAAQNCYFENSGAFTGEVSPALLKDAGCSHVILGHSERRQIFGEGDELINRKIKAVLAQGLTPIFCIGETLEERENDAMMDVLQRQVTIGLDGLSEEQMLGVVVAYEPVWAIGTGKTATGEQAQEAHAFVRGLLAGLFGTPAAEQVRILYGGSVKPDNVDGLMAQMDIDGTLVGGASLKAEDFIRIARFEKN